MKQIDIKDNAFSTLDCNHQVWERCQVFRNTFPTLLPIWGDTGKGEAFKDLLDLYQYIPLVHHPFYEELNGSDNVEHTNLLANSNPDDGLYSAVRVCGTCQSFGDTEVAV